jgi:hypothetical protein
MKTIHLNNRKTELTAELLIGATNLPFASMATNPIGVTVNLGQVVIVTLLNADETAFEIIHVTKSLVSSYTIERAKEGTTAATWPIGTKVSLRATAGLLNNLPQAINGDNVSVAINNLQQKIFTAIETSSFRGNGQVIVAGDVKISTNAPWVAYIYLTDGVTQTPLPVFSPNVLAKDQSAVVLPVTIIRDGTVPDGTLQNPGVAFGQYAAAINAAAALGSNNTALTTNTLGALALGTNSVAVGSGVALGNNSHIANGGVAIGDGAMSVGDVISSMPNTFSTNLVAARPAYYKIAQRFVNESTIVWSRPVAVNTVPVWTASTLYKHGDVVSDPFSGAQFIRKDNAVNYNAFTSHFGGYVGSLSDATTPIFESAELSETVDGEGFWITSNDPILDFGDSAFVTEEIGVMVLDMAGMTVQPTLSFTDFFSSFTYVTSQLMTGLDQVGRIQRFQVPNTRRDNLVRMNIDTVATATKMVVQFYAKGFYAKNWR